MLELSKNPSTFRNRSWLYMCSAKAYWRFHWLSSCKQKWSFMFTFKKSKTDSLRLLEYECLFIGEKTTPLLPEKTLASSRKYFSLGEERLARTFKRMLLMHWLKCHSCLQGQFACEFQKSSSCAQRNVAFGFKGMSVVHLKECYKRIQRNVT